MQITHETGMFTEEMAALAYERYCLEFDRWPWLARRSRESFTACFRDRARGMNGAILTDDGKCEGFMLYTLSDNGERVCCDIPVWGYGAAGERPDKAAAHLFQALADRAVTDRTVDFSVRLYAGDGVYSRGLP